jgi:ATP-binding cassette subfamily F protein uup
MANPVLALRDIALSDGPRPLFEHVKLALQPRARACLVGRNGAGKSTILRLLAGDIDPDAGERVAVAGLRIALVPQEPVLAGETLADFAASRGLPRHTADKAFAEFELEPDAPASTASGGEARRAALAVALASDPDVLLLDEPTNHLDIIAIQVLEQRLARSRAAVLTVSHDRAFLLRLTTSCYWLEERRLHRLGSGFAAFESWTETVEAARAREARRLEGAIQKDERWLSRGVTGRRARNEGRRRRLLALRAEKAMRLNLAQRELKVGSTRSERSGRLAMEAQNVRKTFGSRILLADFSARVMRGERVAIIGANGSGKSTLVQTLIGEVAPDAGVVRHGANLRIAYLDQRRSQLAEDLTLFDILAPSGGDQIMTPAGPRHVSAYARDFLFRDDQLRQPVASLSGGERGRLLLARVLAAPSNLLVLDEPTNDLDMETLDVLEDVLADYSGTIILVSHDRDVIDRVATSTIALNGRGGSVETPGGWSDFALQNSGFFDTEPPARRAAPKLWRPPLAVSPPAKLSFGETRLLAALEAEMPALSARIADAQFRLGDPDFYGRDPVGFAADTAGLEAAQRRLAEAEDEWLRLTERRDQLASGRSRRT